MAKQAEHIPYWKVNLPEKDRPQTCPDFLIDITDKQKRILATENADYHILSWDEVKAVVEENRLDAFQRTPIDLRCYLDYAFKIKTEWGSIINFVQKQRLGWNNLSPSSKPFESPDDIKILYNDWPYGIDERITHLVVWTKFDLEEDPRTGDLSGRGRQEIESFVTRTFRSKCSPDSVVWFKNWRSLKSIEAIEHFHVMLYDPDKTLIAELTKGDVPLSERVVRPDRTGSP